MGNNITDRLKYKESVVKFSKKYGVAKAAYKFGECKRTIYRWRNRYDGTLESLKERLNANEAHAEFYFPYFITKKAPISGAEGRVRYDVAFKATLKGSEFDLITEVTAPIQTLCPCSKEISEFGAHSQRAYAKIEVRM